MKTLVRLETVREGFVAAAAAVIDRREERVVDGPELETEKEKSACATEYAMRDQRLI